MLSLKERLSQMVGQAFIACALDYRYGEVVPSNRPDLGQFQCNGALAAGQKAALPPRQIAQGVADQLGRLEGVQRVGVAGPGFINLTLTDDFLVHHNGNLFADKYLGCAPTAEPLTIIVDYGGATVGRPLHVGHLRAAIIGESLKRLARFWGHSVLGDVHLGDWGLQIGLILAELQNRQPDLPYFVTSDTATYPSLSPVSMDDLAEMYPTASRRARADPAFAEAARQATLALQQGAPGYRTLWRHLKELSVAELRRDYGDLNVYFDLWLGESDTDGWVGPMVERLTAAGQAYKSQGALVIDVAQPGDQQPIPPLILVKSDGAVLYSTTDLATIEQRVQELHAQLILYVVDKRQSLHFQQLFRAAHQTGLAPATTRLEHIGFGTMNGKDGKPFKTRAGGALKLRTLIQMVTDKARERLAEVEGVRELAEAEQQTIARQVGIATLKYADLMNHRTMDYVFDLERFSAFEGRTGPYLLYTLTRARSILHKASEQGFAPGAIWAPVDESERMLLLKFAEWPEWARLAFEQRAPNHLCDYAYTLATTFNHFYHSHHILRETNAKQRASWLAVVVYSVKLLEKVLELLGIETPARM